MKIESYTFDQLCLLWTVYTRTPVALKDKRGSVISFWKYLLNFAFRSQISKDCSEKRPHFFGRWMPSAKHIKTCRYKVNLSYIIFCYQHFYVPFSFFRCIQNIQKIVIPIITKPLTMNHLRCRTTTAAYSPIIPMQIMIWIPTPTIIFTKKPCLWLQMHMMS